MARVLWLLGYPKQALDVSEAAQKAAQKNPHDLAFAFWADMLLRQFRREVGLTQQRAQQLKVLAEEHRLPHYRAWAGILHGWARATPEPTEGIAEMRETPGGAHAVGDRAYASAFPFTLGRGPQRGRAEWGSSGGRR